MTADFFYNSLVKNYIPRQCIFSLFFCNNINEYKNVLLDLAIFNRNMGCPGLKTYAFSGVQGYKNTVTWLSWKRSITFYVWRKFCTNFTTCCSHYQLEKLRKKYTGTAKALWCIQTKSKNSAELTHRLNSINSYI